MLRARGFTLIEIMVVIVILGVLAALVVPRVLERPDEARAVAAKSDIASIIAALKLYRLDNQRYPSSEQGLGALIVKPEAPAWTGLSQDQWLYFFTLAWVVVFFVVAWNLLRGRIGRAMVAIRDQPIAAQAMGVNTSLVKSLTFGVSALYTGAAGALYYSREVPSFWKGLRASKLFGRRGVITFESNGSFVLARRGALPRLVLPGWLYDIRGYRAMYRDFLASPPDGVDKAILQRAEERVLRARDMASAAAEIDARDAVGIVGVLLRDVIAAQRRQVVEQRDAGSLDDEAVREYLSRLDLEEAALMSRMSSRL